jgi:hypothetical protein
VQLAGDVATMLAYLALGIPPAGHLRRLDTQTIAVTGGSFDPPYYTFDGGAPPTLEVGSTYVFETSGVSASHPFAIRADGNVDAYAPTPGLAPIEAQGTLVEIGPETFTLYSDSTGQIYRIEIRPLHEGKAAGPPGFYKKIGGKI